jgi:hypothetical protein
MSSALPLRAALKQGALVTFANWPTVLVEFGLWALYELALGVPVLGGAFMVAVLLGFDVTGLLGQGVRETADLIIGSLATAPVALAAFLIAFGIVAAGGLILIFVAKAGTLAILVASERAAPELHRVPIHMALIRRASRWSLAAVYGGAQRYGRRAASLAGWLCVAYLVIAGLTIGTITAGFHLAADSAWASAWPLLVMLATSAGVLAVTLVNLLFDLARIIVVTDDCSAADALRRMWRFVVNDSRQVIGIFSVTSAALAIATVAWLVATANVAIIGFVPVVGLLVAPLQAAVWIVRGVLFQAVGLATLSAYQTQYRRFREPGAAPAPVAFGGQRA